MCLLLYGEKDRKWSCFDQRCCSFYMQRMRERSCFIKNMNENTNFINKHTKGEHEGEYKLDSTTPTTRLHKHTKVCQKHGLQKTSPWTHMRTQKAKVIKKMIRLWVNYSVLLTNKKTKQYNLAYFHNHGNTTKQDSDSLVFWQNWIKKGIITFTDTRTSPARP